MTGRRRGPCIKVNAMSYARLIKLLAEGTRTCAELAEETGLHKLTVYQYTRELHKARAVHVCMWEQDSRGRHSVRVYMLGEAKDAPRVRETGAERQARCRARKAARALDQILGGAVV